VFAEAVPTIRTAAKAIAVAVFFKFVIFFSPFVFYFVKAFIFGFVVVVNFLKAYLLGCLSFLIADYLVLRTCQHRYLVQTQPVV